jgi:SpoVK/Ycf46/Vps4 family AAA+-type ATPase
MSRPSHSSTSTSARTVLGEKAVEVLRRETLLVAHDSQERVDLGDGARREHGLVGSEIEDALPQAVQVAELETIEIRQTELAADPFDCDRHRDLAADGHGRRSHDLPAQALLLGAGDLVLVMRLVRSATKSSSSSKRTPACLHG